MEYLIPDKQGFIPRNIKWPHLETEKQALHNTNINTICWVHDSLESLKPKPRIIIDLTQDYGSRLFPIIID